MRKASVYWMMILLVALLMLEYVNFEMNKVAFDLLFMGQMSAPFALAFAGADFAGVARLFTPEVGREERKEIKWLFGLWICVAIFNAGLTWFAVVNTMVGKTFGNDVITQEVYLVWAPVVVATVLLLVRVMLVGTLTAFGDRMLHRRGMPFPKAVAPVPAYKPSNDKYREKANRRP